MFRFSALAVLAIMLSSCVFLVDDTSPQPTGPVTPVKPTTPVTTQIAVPAQGSYTYRCTGGTLVVNYVANNQIRVFYDGGFQVLNLSKNSPTLIYTDGKYSWEWTGKTGSLSVGGQVVLNSCVL